jgi:hypothetical protein
VLKDPRTTVTLEEMRANQAMQLELQALRGRVHDALAQILTARRDLKTIETLIAQSADPAAHKALGESAKAALDRLLELEGLFRVPENTKGRPYTGDKVLSHIQRAASFLTSSYAAPSPAAESFAEIASLRVDAAIAELNGYLEGDFAALRDAFSASGLGLLGQSPVAL